MLHSTLNFEMAAMKRKFVVLPVEDLDGEIKVSRPKPLFDTYKKSIKIVEETKGDTCSRTTNDDGHKRDENNGRAENTTIHRQSQNEQRIVHETSVPNQDFLSKESNLNSPLNNHPAGATTSCASIKPTVGKTFKETFAFLEDTSHFKETVAKIKEKEYVSIYHLTK